MGGRVTVAPGRDIAPDVDPLVSVILPVGGLDRLPQFKAVLGCFCCQSEERIEIVAAECSEVPQYHVHCPPGIRHLHIPCAAGSQFNKSRAMNEGVKNARAGVVLLHDADVVVPRDYVKGVLDRLYCGYDAIRPIRFLFHLVMEASQTFAQCGAWPIEVLSVEQNNPGLSTAVRKDVYAAIGGHDKRFDGWGGEDNEFLDRLKTRRLYHGGYESAVHLWHPAAPKKADGTRNREMAARIRSVSPEERILRLTAHSQGTW
jgi:glycosyltransferase involved in cell wall biosynthesis